MLYVSRLHSRGTPGVLIFFYTCFYDHARRLRLEKLLCLELSRSPNGFFFVLLDPGGGFTSETEIIPVMIKIPTPEYDAELL
jgi:hypothetical protein